MTGKPFKDNPGENIIRAYPVIWTHKSGDMKSPFPNEYRVIIALEDLDQTNGFPIIEGKEALACGEWILFSGHKDMKFNTAGGGLAFFLELKF